MSFTINGLHNANEFYSQHYLDDILVKDRSATALAPSLAVPEPAVALAPSLGRP